MAEPNRIGRQTPTQSVVLPYTKTHGEEAIKLYEKTKRTAQDWQKLLIYDILSYNDDGLWVHTKFGYEVSRRNGKNEVIAIRELYGLINGEHMLHTAHRTMTSNSAWVRLCQLLEDAGYKEKEDYTSYKQYGLERIEMADGKGSIAFRTRTSKGGLGEGFDLLVIDEAQEYQDDQETTLKYVVSSSANPQTLFCGTPPTPVSSGTVFMHLRGDVLVVRQINIRSKIKLFAAGKGVICSLCQIIVRSYSNYLRLGRFLSGISLSPAIDVGLFLLLLLSRVFHADARMICSSFTSRISFHFPQVFWFFKRVFSIAVLLDEAVIGNRDFLWIQ